MSNRSRVAALLASLAAVPALLGLTERSRVCEPDSAADPYVLGYTMNRIDGTSESLDSYKGKVILIVNVASKCGLTKQYSALEKLYDDKKEQGFVILAFPANNFLGQEPGTNEEIAAFCSGKFDVSFPLFEKVSVKGDDACELYKQLTALAPPLGGEPEWNFTKFLVDREGNVVARFHPKTTPDAKELVSKVDELLAAK
jgi:glutathione peroxidase